MRGSSVTQGSSVVERAAHNREVRGFDSRPCNQIRTASRPNESQRSRERRLAYQKLHYRANAEAYKQRALAQNRVARVRAYQWIDNYLSSHPCVDCGEADPVVLEFDHRDAAAKKANVSDLAKNAYSIQAIETEVAKCDVRCANCHRRVTFKRRHSEA